MPLDRIQSSSLRLEGAATVVGSPLVGRAPPCVDFVRALPHQGRPAVWAAQLRVAKSGGSPHVVRANLISAATDREAA